MAGVLMLSAAAVWLLSRRIYGSTKTTTGPLTREPSFTKPRCALSRHSPWRPPSAPPSWSSRADFCPVPSSSHVTHKADHPAASSEPDGSRASASAQDSQSEQSATSLWSRIQARLGLTSDLDDIGNSPDPRFTFANERTFLAWARTGLALIGAGVLVAQELRFGVEGGHLVLALPAIGLGGLLGVSGYVRWRSNERAMRLGKPIGQARWCPSS